MNVLNHSIKSQKSQFGHLIKVIQAQLGMKNEMASIAFSDKLCVINLTKIANLMALFDLLVKDKAVQANLSFVLTLTNGIGMY